MTTELLEIQRQRVTNRQADKAENIRRGHLLHTQSKQYLAVHGMTVPSVECKQKYQQCRR